MAGCFGTSFPARKTQKQACFDDPVEADSSRARRRPRETHSGENLQSSTERRPSRSRPVQVSIDAELL